MQSSISLEARVCHAASHRVAELLEAAVNHSDDDSALAMTLQ